MTVGCLLRGLYSIFRSPLIFRVPIGELGCYRPIAPLKLRDLRQRVRGDPVTLKGLLESGSRTPIVN